MSNNFSKLKNVQIKKSKKGLTNKPLIFHSYYLENII